MLVSFSLALLSSLLWWSGFDVFSVIDSQRPPEKQTAVVRAEEPPRSVDPIGGNNVNPGSNAPLSDAERISRLQRNIETDQKELQQLLSKIESPTSEFRSAEHEFAALEKDRASILKSVQDLQKKQKKEELATAKEELSRVEKEWSLSKERFNLAIAEHKTLQEKANSLKQKIARDQQALAQMTTVVEKKQSVTLTATGQEQGSAGTKKSDGKDPPSGDSKDKGSTTTPAPKTTPPMIPIVPSTTGQGSSATNPQAENGTNHTQPENKPPTKEVIEAREKAKVQEETAREAKEKAESITQRMETIRENIRNEQKLLDSAEKQLALARRAKETLTGEFQQKLADHAPDEIIQPLWVKIGEAEKRLTEANQLRHKSITRIQELNSELVSLQTEQIAALKEMEDKHKEAEAAQQKLAWLENPLNPQNILNWILERGPKVIFIILGMLALHLIVRLSANRLVRVIARNMQRGTDDERQLRAVSLVDVFRHSLGMVIFGGGTLMILESMEIPIIPLLGGAAVFGLAVAFGAQNLIRDYFGGFMVLLEDQYSINDVVKINGISGLVEKITLRVTVLRDITGTMHFVPNGTIGTVSNMTHGWSRAFFEIGVAYKEDVDQVMKVLIELGKELRQTPGFSSLILSDPEMLGVDSFGDSAVNIQFFIKTRPLQQWTVKRELLRRIKHRFDDLGIEIPFPHRTIYHRNDSDAEILRGEENHKDVA